MWPAKKIVKYFVSKIKKKIKLAGTKTKDFNKTLNYLKSN
jgi:hypothetical protein